MICQAMILFIDSSRKILIPKHATRRDINIDEARKVDFDEQETNPNYLYPNLEENSAYTKFRG